MPMFNLIHHMQNKLVLQKMAAIVMILIAEEVHVLQAKGVVLGASVSNNLEHL